VVERLRRCSNVAVAAPIRHCGAVNLRRHGRAARHGARVRWRTRLQWSSSREEYDAARADERYVLEQFTYESDGLTVGAYLYRPRARSARPLPVIVYNRGSFTRPSGFAGEMLVMANRYRQAGAFSDLAAVIAPRSSQANFTPLIFPDLNEQNRDRIIERRSAIRWADRIRTPMLIMHGTADQDMPVEHSQPMAAELSRLGRTHRLLLFERQQHRIGRRGAARDPAAIEWFRRFGGG
jgi:dipeptidyl aminopeptidase/acylaminoacyl peptidase